MTSPRLARLWHFTVPEPFFCTAAKAERNQSARVGRVTITGAAMPDAKSRRPRTEIKGRISRIVPLGEAPQSHAVLAQRHAAFAARRRECAVGCSRVRGGSVGGPAAHPRKSPPSRALGFAGFFPTSLHRFGPRPLRGLPAIAHASALRSGAHLRSRLHGAWDHLTRSLYEALSNSITLHVIKCNVAGC